MKVKDACGRNVGRGKCSGATQDELTVTMNSGDGVGYVVGEGSSIQLRQTGQLNVKSKATASNLVVDGYNQDMRST